MDKYLYGLNIFVLYKHVLLYNVPYKSIIL